MALTKGFTDELKSITALPVLGAAKDELLNLALLNRLEKHLDTPVRMYAASPADSKLYFSASAVEAGDGAGKTIPPVENQLVTSVAGSIDFQAITSMVTGITLTKSGSTYSHPVAGSTGQFIVGCFVRRADGTYDCVYSSTQVSLAAAKAIDVGVLFATLSGLPVGFIYLESTDTNGRWKTPGSATAVIENKVGSDIAIYRFGAGSGSGSGSGDGLFNYVINPKAASNVSSGLTVAASGFTVTRGTAESNYSDSYFNIAGNTTVNKTVDWSLDTLNKKHHGAVMRLSMNVMLDLGSGSAGVYKVGLHDGTTYVPGTELVLANNANTKWQALFPMDTAKTYTVRLECTTAGNALDTIYIDDIFVGEEAVVASSSSEEWEAFTPTFVNDSGHSATVIAKKRRVLDTMEIELFYTPTADGDAGGVFTFTIPNGLTTPAVNNNIYGSGFLLEEVGATDIYKPVTVIDPSSGLVNLRFATQAIGSTNLRILEQEDFGISASRFRQLAVRMSIPINEWAGQQVTAANSRVEYLHNSNTSTSGTNSTSFAYGPLGAAIVSVNSANNDVVKRTRAVRDYQATDKLFLEVSPGNNKWINAADVFPYHDTGTHKYGLSWQNVSGTTDVDVVFGGDGAAQGLPWSGFTSWRWRITKCANPLGIGTGLATSNQAGAVPTYETGSFTPELREGVNPLTAAAAVGRYTKIGTMVSFAIELRDITLSGTGTLSIAGLPYAAIMNTPLAVSSERFTTGDTNQIQALILISGDAKTIGLRYVSNNGSAAPTVLSAAMLSASNNSDIAVSGVYWTE